MPKDGVHQKIDLSDPTEPRLQDSGVPLDALIAYYCKVANENVSQVARAYHLPVEDVEAALEYYRRHPAIIDARITLSAV